MQNQNSHNNENKAQVRPSNTQNLQKNKKQNNNNIIMLTILLSIYKLNKNTAK